MQRHHATHRPPTPGVLSLLVAAGVVAASAAAAACADAGAPVSPDVTAAANSVQSDGGANGNCASVAGTVAARFVASPERGWQGRLLVSFGDGPLERATLFDRSASADLERLAAGLPWRGTETITVTFPDGAFDVDGSFVGVPAPTPGLYQLNETGDIVNGSGRFAGATGHVSVHGPFVFPPVFGPPDAGPNPLLSPWIAEVHGSLCGV